LSFQLGNEGLLFSLQTAIRNKTDEISRLQNTIDIDTANMNQQLSVGASLDRFTGSSSFALSQARNNRNLQNLNNQLSELNLQIDQVKVNIDFFKPEITEIKTQNVPIIQPLENIVEVIKTSIDPIISDAGGNNNLLIGAAAIGLILLIL